MPALNPIRRSLDHVRKRTVRIGVTGLARSGKTTLLSALAAGLLAPGALGGRIRHARLAPSGAESLPRFEVAAHLAALAADPPRWPARTDAVSLLAIDLTIGHAGGLLPARRLRLELLDYPGEWLLDLPLLAQDFEAWSAATLARLQHPDLAPITRDFLAFSTGLPANAAADESLAEAGHRLYRATLARLRDEAGLSMLQPGRFLMPAPGASPPWERFFPVVGRGAASLGEGGLGGARPGGASLGGARPGGARPGGARPGGGSLRALLARRYDAYVGAVQQGLVSPLFGDMDRLVVLADLLSALHTGPQAFADARAALSASGAALRWRGSWLEAFTALARLRLPPRIIRRVAFAASKADHVAERQRGNLAALVGNIAGIGETRTRSASFAIAAVRCTEDFIWSLDGHPVSAVRGRVLGERQITRSYPGEVPDTPPGPDFWSHRFLNLPAFEPLRLPEGGRLGVPNIGLDGLLGFLLEDLL